MLAIFKREFKTYFKNPLGYIFLAVLWLIAGYYFRSYNLEGYSTDLMSVFSIIYNMSLFLVPLLTMRLMSEDRRQKTDQALLTAPISLLSLVMGKFLSAMALYICGTSITLVYALFMSAYSAVEWSVVISCFIGINLAGGALIAIGLFVSSFTENQMIAAILGIAANIFVSLFDLLADVVNVSFIKSVILGASFDENFTNFSIGTIDLGGLVFFLSVIGIFIFLTIRMLDRRRWA